MRHLHTTVRTALAASAATAIALVSCTGAHAAGTSRFADVTLGHQHYRVATAMMDPLSPQEGSLELNLTAPFMTARGAAPRRSDQDDVSAMLAQVPVSIQALDRQSVDETMQRKLVNDDRSVVGSLERRDPRERLELRSATTQTSGLTEYVVDEARMRSFTDDYSVRYGKKLLRNQAYEPDWYVARAGDGRVTSFISCDQPNQMRPSLSSDARTTAAALDPAELAGCIHYFGDATRQVFIQMSYQRVWLKDWKTMEDGVRRILADTEIQ